MDTVQSINLEEIPDQFLDEIWPELNVNGGNVIQVDEKSDFCKWLMKQGFVIGNYNDGRKKHWEHLVVFR